MRRPVTALATTARPVCVDWLLGAALIGMAWLIPAASSLAA
ncbi:hypothetical protein J2Y00_004796 [Deinococcus soli (ex Cha et al. 2016)]|uniref:Uncharacterized protein n=2 Tax=Deinococcus soli (ex Cha et al. 2016) TaxID=1309411 RepID=A0ACC6KNY4_9DEIO|nr:hypothetical protein [Deinococcus soli (ex Cha et al. 2016)]MDR6331097.1 hypothetical protein [Deinococcus soli (ex Cha et al. 2016)]MDR6754293.1 hypothetical protein [Deinococcus soli (ex Cha et al. 2016)]